VKKRKYHFGYKITVFLDEWQILSNLLLFMAIMEKQALVHLAVRREKISKETCWFK
jgi:hypothetical protein